MDGWMVGWRYRYVDVIFEQNPRTGTSLAVQQLRLHLPTQGFGLIPVWELESNNTSGHFFYVQTLLHQCKFNKGKNTLELATIIHLYMFMIPWAFRFIFNLLRFYPSSMRLYLTPTWVRLWFTKEGCLKLKNAVLWTLEYKPILSIFTSLVLKTYHVHRRL